MNVLDDERNIAFMSDPRRIAAQEEMDGIIRHIVVDLKSNGSATYYLTVLPPLLKKLEAACEKLNLIETQIICELKGEEG